MPLDISMRHSVMFRAASMLRILVLLCGGLIMSGCDNSKSLSPDSFRTLPPRTAAQTWEPSSESAVVIDRFLARYPGARGKRYGEILKDKRARLELPHDEEGQRMLDHIYVLRARDLERTAPEATQIRFVTIAIVPSLPVNTGSATVIRRSKDPARDVILLAAESLVPLNLYFAIEALATAKPTPSKGETRFSVTSDHTFSIPSSSYAEQLQKYLDELKRSPRTPLEGVGMVQAIDIPYIPMQ